MACTACSGLSGTLKTSRMTGAGESSCCCTRARVQKWIVRTLGALHFSLCSVSRPPFVRYLEICNQICVKLLQLMSGVIPRHLKETASLSQTVFLASTNAAYTQRDRHTHRQTTIAIGEMQCVAFRLKNYRLQT